MNVRHLLPVLLLVAAPALADDPKPKSRREEVRDAWKLFWAERRIENTMVLGHLRGLLSRRPPAPDWTPRVAGKGRLERGPGGIPILFLEGTPEEMGTQHGTLLRNELRAMEHYVRALVGKRRLPGARKRARQSEQFDIADYIRDQLTQAGITLEDRRDGTTWRMD